MDYSKQSTQARVEEILDSLRNSSKYVSPDFGENWLTSFTSYVDSYAEYFDFNITTEQQFIDTLRNEFFLNNIYSSDVAFNEEGTKIIASRFIIQLVETWGTEEAKEAYVKLREAAANITDVEVVPFQPWLSFVDQFIIIRPLTIQLLSIAAAIVMVIAIIFIPNFITALCVFFTIVSTEFGVMGLMALWGVSLDIISIMCLIMCIGFSVDVRINPSQIIRASHSTNTLIFNFFSFRLTSATPIFQVQEPQRKEYRKRCTRLGYLYCRVADPQLLVSLASFSSDPIFPKYFSKSSFSSLHALHSTVSLSFLSFYLSLNQKHSATL